MTALIEQVRPWVALIIGVVLLTIGAAVRDPTLLALGAGGVGLPGIRSAINPEKAQP